MIKKFLTTFITGLALIAGLGLAAASSAGVASAAADGNHTVRATLNSDGTWTTEYDGKLVSAQTEDATTPIANNRFYFGPGHNPERLLCIKDYTPESAVSWDANRVAQEWSKANEFHMWWDDMNGGGTNCITYDNEQTINLYSYSESSTACGSYDLTLNQSGFVVGATAWLNRTADNTNCRQTFSLRQNILSAIVGRLLGLSYHTTISDSVMNSYLTYRLIKPYPRPADFNGIAARY
jgi:hypothetical protein